jgi:hypothetical protein
MGFCFKKEKEKPASRKAGKIKRCCYVHGGKQTLVCSHTVHNLTVTVIG